MNHNKFYAEENTGLVDKHIEAEVSNRLKIKETQLPIQVPRNFYMRSILAPRININADVNVKDQNLAYQVNVFNNDNLDAKLNFVNDYFKNQRKLMVDKRINKLERSTSNVTLPRKALNHN